MIKKTFYQNSKYAQELIQSFESDFVFGEKTVNRIKISEINAVKKDLLVKLSERINSISLVIFLASSFFPVSTK